MYVRTNIYHSVILVVLVLVQLSYGIRRRKIAQVFPHLIGQIEKLECYKRDGIACVSDVVLAQRPQPSAFKWAHNTPNHTYFHNISLWNDTNTIVSGNNYVNLPCFAVVMDIDNDGVLDIISGGYYDSKVSWYHNNNNGTFGLQKVISTSNHSPVDIAIADMNNDGLLDLVVIGFGGPIAVSWYRNLGNSQFEANTILENLYRVFHVKADDLDNDGWIDVIGVSTQSLFWFRNLKNGRFSNRIVIGEQHPEGGGLEVGDFNMDGFIDIVLAKNKEFILFTNNGNGEFNITTKLNLCDGPLHLFRIDIDDDGYIDFVFTCSNFWHSSVKYSSVGWCRNTKISEMPFDEANCFIIDKLNYRLAPWISVSDYNGDGFIDILLVSYVNDAIWYANMDGKGVFTKQMRVFKGFSYMTASTGPLTSTICPDGWFCPPNSIGGPCLNPNISAPSSPTNVNIHGKNGSIIIEWKENNILDNYLRYLITCTNDGQLIASLSIENNRSAVIKGLENGKLYNCSVQADNGCKLSNEVYGNIFLVGFPNPPFNVVAFPSSKNIIVKWTAPKYSGGTDLIEYIVIIYPSLLNVTVRSNVTQIIITKPIIHSNILYQFGIIARNQRLNSEISSLSQPVRLLDTSHNQSEDSSTKYIIMWLSIGIISILCVLVLTIYLCHKRTRRLHTELEEIQSLVGLADPPLNSFGVENYTTFPTNVKYIDMSVPSLELSSLRMDSSNIQPESI